MTKRFVILLATLVLVVPFVFYGCGGSDGSTGATGATGPQGPQGPAGDNGAVTNTNESCMVCHTTGRIADISDSATTGMHYQAKYNQQTLAVTLTSVDNAAGFPKVSFHVQAGTDNVKTLARTNLRFYAADLTPAGTVTTEGTRSTDEFERWASESTGGTLDNTDAANGNYVYTFATPFDNAVNLAENFSVSHTQRIVVRASLTGFNGGAGFEDFIPASGFPTAGTGFIARQFVTTDACKKCHGPQMAGTAHGSSYTDVRACVVCHTPIGLATGEEMQTLEAWLASLIHKIHAAKEVAGFPGRIMGKGYTAVTYPQEVTNCVTCHTTSGLSLGAGDLIDNWKNHPTRAACGTCHTAVNFATGVGHSGPLGTGGVQTTDAGCTFCHPATGSGNGGSITDAHDFSPTSTFHPNTKIVPEFNVTLALTAPANGTHYVANENVTATVTLRKHSDNTAVAGTLYTTAKDNTGITGGGLASASIYFYGPWALPKPITGTQSNALFVNAANANVLTDATGFKYKFTIPATATAGTYGVRVRIGDYGRVNDNNYVVESIAFTTVQVGTATAEKRVSGDACISCHGNGTAPFHDARHIVVWKTDECISCHDYSGGHADVLSNRVHAVHSSNKWGDLLNIADWADVTYPLTSYGSKSESTGLIGANTPGEDRCSFCHSSGNTSYRTKVGKTACVGCHGDDPGPLGGGATNHMNQNGGDFVDITP